MHNSVAAILGVGPALGASLAHRFAKEGFAIALMARSSEKLQSLQAEIEQQGGKALAIARWNWSNNPSAYWINLWLTTVVDLGFLLFILFRGYVTLSRGLPGPITWAIALVSLSTLKLHINLSFCIKASCLLPYLDQQIRC